MFVGAAAKSAAAIVAMSIAFHAKSLSTLAPSVPGPSAAARVPYTLIT